MVRLIEDSWISRSSLHDAMTAPALPRWDVVDALVEILADKARSTSPESELDRFAALWQRAARASDEGDVPTGGLPGESRPTQDAVVAQRLVVVIDVARFATHSDRDQMAVRRHVAEAVDLSLSALQVDLDDSRQEDRGDGVLILFPPSVPSPYIVGMWVALLHKELQRINADRDEAIQLRVGMQKGAVALDQHGVAGITVNGATRLCDSNRTRNLQTDGNELVLAISEALYKGAVDGYPLADPDKFTHATVPTKTGVTLAWFRAMGRFTEH
ncbi:hypothetical protein [Streptomyces brasiliscabiei]|uniref:hypothetical protein n=1 Tax=Streptomyces brasiliscabiei TaxID=2736302 RepID=UPI001C116509|nr:hypothetical protein [Streptomyces brasiliscabiei]